MTHIERRHVLKLASISGLLLGVGVQPARAAHASPAGKAIGSARGDRDFVLAAGMTEAEADSWESANHFAAAFLGLIRDAEGHDASHLIHVLQDRLLTRPTYRRYLESAGAGERVLPAAPELEELAQPVDKERALESGLTEAEAQCLERLSAAAVSYRSLPKLHTMEDHEVGHALHALRDMLWMRPTQRRYDELAEGR